MGITVAMIASGCHKATSDFERRADYQAAVYKMKHDYAHSLQVTDELKPGKDEDTCVLTFTNRYPKPVNHIKVTNFLYGLVKPGASATSAEKGLTPYWALNGKELNIPAGASAKLEIKVHRLKKTRGQYPFVEYGWSYEYDGSPSTETNGRAIGI